jgi:hypothetical protein
MGTILVGIDGTGSRVVPGASRNAKYDADFTNSHVRKLCNLHGGATLYLRGPVMLGGGLVEAINSGVNFIRGITSRAGASHDVLLTGYSRGAAGAVAIATRLGRLNIDVKAIMLFDCVDRHVAVDAEVIPRNVGFVRHVIRHPGSSSRESFSNDGLRYFPPTVYPHAYQFMCTHGGMGGMPWTPDTAAGQTMNDLIDEGGYDGMTNITFAQDAAGSKRVWNSCLDFFSTHRFL